jgi:hypothetical protein
MFMGDESWLFYAYHHKTIWAASWDDIEKIERPSYFHEKTMFIIFFNEIWDYKTAILPQRQRMNSIFFIERVIHPLAGFCCSERRQPHERRVVMHFDNSPIHNTLVVQQYLADYRFRRMNYPVYSSDLASCDFFLFGAMK